MKKIGFIDYYISEWHANNYPAWIKKAVETTGVEAELAYAYAELDVSPNDNVTTDEWCKKFAVEKCNTIEEICKKSDYLFILSPDNSEKHLDYAKKVFPFAKPTYMDKTFAPNFETAQEIFAIADKYNTPMFSSSALRYSTELDEYKTPVYSVMTTGPGEAPARYGIHQVEMIQKLMGNGAKRVMSTMTSTNMTAVIDYGNGRKAQFIQSAPLGFAINVEENDQVKESKHTFIESDFFQGLINSILAFFQSGKVAVKKQDTLEIMAVLDAIVESQKQPFVWTDCKK